MRVVNVVLTAVFSQKVDLVRFTRLTGADYRPMVFAAASLRFNNPRCTLLLFQSGRCVCIGATCVHDAHYGIDCCLRVLIYLHAEVYLLHTAVQNIVTHDDVGDAVDINRLAADDAMQTQYNPELFPGLRMALTCDGNSRATIFYQGNIIVTGCRCMDTVAAAWHEVRSKIEAYRVRKQQLACNALTHTNNAMQRQIDRLLYDEPQSEVTEVGGALASSE
ncbi:hypothetical protein CYMTET_43364 [Cymbomonas tetramitiformis]|uniref:Uncharacterized protein n=1 Tax=Cymbomonas tetramitiformis TaxID=36881 RepID=A0AAE0C2D2_9CHLO|nr:hypothetical protein CYMTET_43364 [Cymbomonas tetramitiformis]